MDNVEKNIILIVEDDSSNVMELVHILQSEYKLNVALDGASALQHVKEYPPDLILLDIIMPGLNGFDVLSELQKSDETANIPVIFITGLNSNEDEHRGISLGAVDYICKPFDDMIVKRRVLNQIQIVNLRRELEAR